MSNMNLILMYPQMKTLGKHVGAKVISLNPPYYTLKQNSNQLKKKRQKKEKRRRLQTAKPIILVCISKQT